jgi:hypothetical protein
MEHSWEWGAYSLVVTVVLFAAGAWYFDRAEGATVDRM